MRNFNVSSTQHDQDTLIKINKLPPEKIALIEFLHERKFDTFATFTTSLPITLKSTRRLAEKFGKEFLAGKAIDFFWCAEPFDVREGYHFHGLINSHQSNDVQLRQTNQMFFDWWVSRYGRCQFLPITGTYNAEFYLTKYMTKQLTDYDFHFIHKN